MAISIPAIIDTQLAALQVSMRSSADDTAPSVPVAIGSVAADMLRILTNLVDSATLTATGGTAVSVQDTSAFTGVNSLVGATVTFDSATTTAALRGISAKVLSNTVSALFFAIAALPATPVSGDTYVVTYTVVDDKLNTLNSGALNDASVSVYGGGPALIGAALLLLEQLGATPPSYLVAAAAEPFGIGSPHAEGVFVADALEQVRDAVAAYTAPA